MKEHRIWKYRYRVVDEDNPDRDALEWIYSTTQLRDGRTYKVRVNNNMKGPRDPGTIDEIFTKNQQQQTEFGGKMVGAIPCSTTH